MFDLGITSPSEDGRRQLAEKLDVEAFVLPIVSSSGTTTAGAIAAPMYGGGWIAAPLQNNSAGVEVDIVSARTGKVLMRGLGSGASSWSSGKGVINSQFSQIFDRAFDENFFAHYWAYPDFVDRLMLGQATAMAALNSDPAPFAGPALLAG